MSDGVRHSRTWANHERQRVIPGRPRRCVLRRPYKVGVYRQDFSVWSGVEQLTQTADPSVSVAFLSPRSKSCGTKGETCFGVPEVVIFRESRDGVAK